MYPTRGPKQEQASRANKRRVALANSLEFNPGRIFAMPPQTVIER